MNQVHVVVPDGIDDPRRPSGGNVYDRRVCDGLGALGWSVHEHAAPGRWPNADGAALAGVAQALAEMPDDALVLIDGLLASVLSEVLQSEAGRLRLVVLMHMPRDEPREIGALSAARAIVATSQWTKRWLSDNYGLPPGRVHVVAPGADPAELVEGTPAGGRLLCVGAVTAIKGHDLLLDALDTIEDVAWGCVLVGALDVDAAFVEALRRRTGVGHLSDRVSFAGALTAAELAVAYAEADVLLLASRAETYGMVVTEALARGLPVIATDVGGVREAVGRAADGSRPGVLVPPEDPHAFALAVRDWLTDPRVRGRLRAAARSRRQTLVDWSRTSRRLSVALDEIAGENHPSADAPRVSV